MEIWRFSFRQISPKQQMWPVFNNNQEISWKSQSQLSHDKPPLPVKFYSNILLLLSTDHFVFISYANFLRLNLIATATPQLFISISHRVCRVHCSTSFLIWIQHDNGSRTLLPILAKKDFYIRTIPNLLLSLELSGWLPFGYPADPINR